MRRAIAPIAARPGDPASRPGRRTLRVADAKCIGYSRSIDQNAALAALAALAHPTRLAAFRLLVRHEPAGLATGQLVATSGLTQSTFSTHLAILAKAGLVRSERNGRNQIQRAAIGTLRALMLFLARDCCEGRAELYEPLIAELTCC